MAQSDQTLAQINDLQSQYKNLGVTDPSAIYGKLISKVQGFQPQYQELANANTAAYAAPAQAMQDYQSRYGSGMNAGPDAFARLSAMLQGVGQKQGTADTLSNTIDTMKGRIGDITNGVYQGVQSVGKNLMDQIGVNQQLYSTQSQAELARAQMAQQAALARAAQAAQAQPNWQDIISKLSGGGQPTVNKEQQMASLVDQMKGILLPRGMNSQSITAMMVNPAIRNQLDPLVSQVKALGYDPNKIRF